MPPSDIILFPTMFEIPFLSNEKFSPVVQRISLAYAALSFIFLLVTHGAAMAQNRAKDAVALIPPVQRLGDVLRKQWREMEVAPLPVPLDSPWVTESELVREGEILLLPKGTAPHRLQLPFVVDTRKYNAFRVTMRVDAGGHCRLNWRSDVEPEFPKNSGATAALQLDGEFHTYTLPLDNPEGTWVGTVGHILFFPAWQVPCAAEIRSMEFVYDPALRSPRRITIPDHTLATYEAFWGSQPPWTLVVPPGGIFETAVGLSPRAWQVYASDGVRFLVFLEDSKQRKKVLIDKTLTPQTAPLDRRWIRLQRDLSEYAGEQVTLTLAVHPLETREGDYAYWGNPLVFSRKENLDDIPIFLVSWDTVRADHLSVYGYERDTTPNLKAFAANEAVVFENAFAQDAWTLPSHMTMLTGLYPKNHGVTPNTNLSEDVETLPERLQRSGYVTAGFTGINWWLEAKHGFAQGFDYYENPKPYRHGFHMYRAAYAWLTEHDTRRQFLFLHNYDAHSKSSEMGYSLPYQSEIPRFSAFSALWQEPVPFPKADVPNLVASDLLIAANRGQVSFSPNEVRYLKTLYDDALYSIDAAFQDFLDELVRRGLYQNSLIIVTADHGESFGEHGKYMHEEAYLPCTHVPLIIKFPGRKFAGQRYRPPVMLTDLLPTVLDVLGIEDGQSRDGQSLLALLEGRAAPAKYVFTRRSTVDCVQTDTWKLMRDSQSGAFSLYNIAEDPQESRDRYNTEPSVVQELQPILENFYSAVVQGWYLRFVAGETPVEFNVRIQSDTPIESLTAPAQSAEQTTAEPVHVNDNEMLLRLPLNKYKVSEYVVVTAPTATLTVTVESTQPFRENSVKASPTSVSRLERTLSPETQKEFMLPQFFDTGAEPAFLAWYVNVPKGTAAQELSDEERRALEALGYGH